MTNDKLFIHSSTIFSQHFSQTCDDILWGASGEQENPLGMESIKASSLPVTAVT